MPKRGWVWVGPDYVDSDEERPAKKKPAARGKKGKAIAPNWSAATHAGWSDDKPTGTWGKRCVDTWCLLAPYDSAITEAQWKKYYDERSTLDRVNTLRGGSSNPIESEELGQPTWTILQDSGESIAAAIMGSAQLQDANRKKRIAHVLLGFVLLSMALLSLVSWISIADCIPPLELAPRSTSIMNIIIGGDLKGTTMNALQLLLVN
ncbi:hypothetical protein BN14_08613 [Rhizoctonia solani AG-1 IB]|uniref:Uncharacterized protein n=1 Tax=Thanatephorus cucumeris (strain AG1-IB / isolate 7/3/14) TaxID=1108050 RepID=M5CEY7_THACB|nr:hypothetical protein BN14_08613 [Rhizoctonia solani AG-1 IB]